MPRDDANRLLIEFRLDGRGYTGLRETLGAVGHGLAPPWTEDLREASRQLVLALEQLRATGEAQIEATSHNTAAVIQNTVVQAANRESIASSAGKAAIRVLASGLGLSPLVTGLVRLFGGGDRGETAASPKPYAWPPSIHFEGLVSRTGAPPSKPPALREEEWQTGDREERVASRPVNVTVQVQALDSRSFLEHSDEIARAVREALLNSHVLNDALAEL